MWPKAVSRNGTHLYFIGSPMSFCLGWWSTSFKSVLWVRCDCKYSTIPGSANPYLGGMERMAYSRGLNISRSAVSPIINNPILLPSFCFALNQLWTDMVVKYSHTLTCFRLTFFLFFFKLTLCQGFLNPLSMLVSLARTKILSKRREKWGRKSRQVHIRIGPHARNGSPIFLDLTSFHSLSRGTI